MRSPPTHSLPTPFGVLLFHVERGRVLHLRFAEGPESAAPAPPDPIAGPLRAWLAGDLAALAAVPAEPRGTPFQRAVWAELRRVPPGQTRTYGELARRLGTGPRAVGAACRANPLLLVVPCHRVVAASGALGGYAGGVARKAALLRHEGVRFDARGRVAR